MQAYLLFIIIVDCEGYKIHSAAWRQSDSPVEISLHFSPDYGSVETSRNGRSGHMLRYHLKAPQMELGGFFQFLPVNGTNKLLGYRLLGSVILASKLSLQVLLRCRKGIKSWLSSLLTSLSSQVEILRNSSIIEI